MGTSTEKSRVMVGEPWENRGNDSLQPKRSQKRAIEQGMTHENTTKRRFFPQSGDRRKQHTTTTTRVESSSRLEERKQYTNLGQEDHLKKGLGHALSILYQRQSQESVQTFFTSITRVSGQRGSSKTADSEKKVSLTYQAKLFSVGEPKKFDYLRRTHESKEGT